VAWIAAVGVLTDHGVSNATDLFDFVKKNLNHLIGDTKIDENELFAHSFLGTLAKILDSARIVEGRKGSQMTANFLAESKSYEDIFNDESADKCPLLYWSEAVKREFKRLVADFNKKRKLLKGKIIYYEIPSSMSIKSSLAGYLTQFYKDKILVIAQKFGNNLDISFRRGDKVKTDLNKMARKAIHGISDSEGGGHESAAGARIPVKYIAKFLKQL
jgi:oligoribonuclease NrnB/cAMP/cGMP phosphodiesterase (DHH superfamily)